MADKLKVLTHGVDPMEILGRAVTVYMKSRINDKAGFYFRAMEYTPGKLNGYDAERLNLTIDIGDIDFIIRG